MLYHTFCVLSTFESRLGKRKKKSKEIFSPEEGVLLGTPKLHCNNVNEITAHW